MSLLPSQLRCGMAPADPLTGPVRLLVSTMAGWMVDCYGESGESCRG